VIVTFAWCKMKEEKITLMRGVDFTKEQTTECLAVEYEGIIYIDRFIIEEAK